MPDTQQLDPLALIAQAPPRLYSARFQSEGVDFSATLRIFTRSDLDKIRTKCIKRVWEREVRAFRDELDEPKFRSLLAASIQSWSGLTYRSLAHICRRDAEMLARAGNGHAEVFERDVPCDARNVAFFLEHVTWFGDDGTPKSAVDWLWTQLTTAADEVAVFEEKKDNG